MKDADVGWLCKNRNNHVCELAAAPIAIGIMILRLGVLKNDY